MTFSGPRRVADDPVPRADREQRPRPPGGVDDAPAPPQVRDGPLDLARLPPLSVSGRMTRLRARLDEAGLDAAVIVDRSNVRWLTGFSGTNGAVILHGERDAALITDGRYAEQAVDQAAAAGCGDCLEVVIAPDAADAATRLLRGAARVGLEDTVSWAQQRHWLAAVDGGLVALSGVVQQLRACKDHAELARIEAAAAIADAALGEACTLIRPGVTEIELRDALEEAMRSRRARGPAYPTIVASGPNSALPHAEPTRRRLRDGDLTVIDVGAEVDGYRSDMTRTFHVGEPSPRAVSIVEAVTRSQAAGVARVRAGARAREVHQACLSVLEQEGIGEAFVHGAGHGIGLDVHELPNLSVSSEDELRAGQVITVEPGAYFAGFGGARVEDLLLVTEPGSRVLTAHPKDATPQSRARPAAQPGTPGAGLHRPNR